jgi:hypothetical protein
MLIYGYWMYTKAILHAMYRLHTFRRLHAALQGTPSSATRLGEAHKSSETACETMSYVICASLFVNFCLIVRVQRSPTPQKRKSTKHDTNVCIGWITKHYCGLYLGFIIVQRYLTVQSLYIGQFTTGLTILYVLDTVRSVFGWGTNI